MLAEAERRALLARPRLLLLDEPTTGLDPAKREEMWDVVRSLVGDGSTVLLTTQYLEEADALADDITVIDHGRVIAEGSPRDLKRIVGGQRLTVQPSEASDVGTVRTILAQVGTDRPDENRPGVFTVPVDGDAALTRAVAAFDAAGVRLTELSLHLPSLDEVFFRLTGRTGAAETEDAA